LTSDEFNCLARGVELTNMIEPKFKMNEKPWFDKYRGGDKFLYII
jgi:hypothetical protein